MQIVYTLIISLFFGTLFFYIINWAVIPWDENNVLSIKNFLIFSVLFVLFFATFFSVFHQIVDKLFFRRFYEKPKLIKSLRRGALLSIVLISIAWLKVFDLFEWHIIALDLVLGILFEVLFLSLEGKHTSKSSANTERLSNKKE